MPEDLPGLERSFRFTVENRLEPWEFRYKAKNGQVRWARTSSRPVRENNVVVGVRGVFSDITDHKKLEEELIKAHKIDSIGVLAGGLAHDFNNILTGIKGNISLVRQVLDPADKSGELLFEAEKAVAQAKCVTQQLLTFAKGGGPVKKVTAISSLLRETTVFATRGSEVRCIFNIASDLHLVQIDSGQITQVINNITINAVQAMPAGGTISVTAENVDISGRGHIPLKAGKYVRIAIQDTGVGIPRHYLEKVFDPYFTTKDAGNGLGLTTSYSIIKNHEGHITVESEIGKGTTFLIHLPVFSEKVDVPLPLQPVAAKRGSGRILVLDDDSMITKVLEKILRSLNYTAECFPDSDQAVARYRKTWGTPDAFDAVILDLTVPGGKGAKAAMGVLLEINPAIKAIVSSGYSNNNIVANYKEYGFSAILPKPYSIEEVSETLSSLWI